MQTMQNMDNTDFRGINSKMEQIKKGTLLLASALVLLSGCASVGVRDHYRRSEFYGNQRDPYFDDSRHQKYSLKAALVVPKAVRSYERTFQPCSREIDFQAGEIATNDAARLLRDWFSDFQVVRRPEDAADADFVVQLGRPDATLRATAACGAGAATKSFVAGVITATIGWLFMERPRIEATFTMHYRVVRTPPLEPWASLAGSQTASGRGISGGFGEILGSSKIASREAVDNAMATVLKSMLSQLWMDAPGLRVAVREYKEGREREVAAAAAVPLIETVNLAEVPTFDVPARLDDIAVVIGVEKHTGNLPRAEYAGDDARLIEKYLRALGYVEGNIALLVNEGATLASLRRTLETWLPNRATAKSRVFVYYAGHGAPDPAKGEAYLVPHDGDPSYLADTGYPLNRLYEKLGAMQVASATVVVDACFSGAGGRSVMASGVRPLVMVDTRLTMPGHVAIVTSAGANEIAVSSPQRRHGLFTYHFLKEIKTGKSDLADIYEAVVPAVAAEAKRLNVTQNPFLAPGPDSVRGRFLLRP